MEITEERLSLDVSRLVVVIPTFNESRSIGQVLDEVSHALTNMDYSVLVVDGHSTDGTCKIAREKGATVIYQHGVGYGDALLTGFTHAKENMGAEMIAMMDGDLTYNAEDIPVLMQHIMKDYKDLAVGNRFGGMEEGAMPFINRVGNKFLSWATRAFLKVRINDSQCGLRVFRASLVDRLSLTKEGMPFAVEMLAEAKFCGARISEAPVSYRPRVGEAKLCPLRDGLRIFGTVLRLMRDTQPLLFFGGIGLLLGLAGATLGLDVTLAWLRTGSVSRMASLLLCVLLLMGAMQFLTIGLVADMIKGLRRSKNSGNH